MYLYLREIETINGSKKRRRDKTDANEYIKLSKIDDTIRYQLIFFNRFGRYSLNLFAKLTVLFLLL
ncbi:Hypothetical protein CFV354_1402 [Campylobacter fetus subsp. venerealis NCTC 10354]|nr:Hypothetical protein CFV354_1402 [Campylobacter fetus subsp. venerealis NCTC 10354]